MPEGARVVLVVLLDLSLLNQTVLEVVEEASERQTFLLVDACFVDALEALHVVLELLVGVVFALADEFSEALEFLESHDTRHQHVVLVEDVLQSDLQQRTQLEA